MKQSKSNRIWVQLLAVLLVVSLLVACGSGTGPAASEDPKEASSEPATESKDKDESSEQQKPAEDSDEPIAIELMQQGWVAMPTDANDPYQKWVNDTFHVDFTLNTTGSTFEDQYLVRFASGSPPDIICLNSTGQVNTLYDQEVIIDDWTPYLAQIPSWEGIMTDESKMLFTTEEGKLQVITGQPEPGIWSIKIRQDWLENLGLEVPTTADEILEVARAFTFDDPDGNGEDDTYGFTSAGGNTSLGEMAFYQRMYGPAGFHIADGKVDHEILNGNKKLFLDFMRRIVDEKIIDPDWYTVSWDERKPKLFSGAHGICYYPGVLVGESEGATGNTGETINWFKSMAMPVAQEGGGLFAPVSINNGRFLTVSTQAAADETKMNKILEILESICYPNDDYWTLRWGIGLEEGIKKIPVDDFIYIDTLGPEGAYYRSVRDGGFEGAFDWGYSFSSRGDLVVEGSTPEPSDAGRVNMEMDSATMQMPHQSGEVHLLNLEPGLVEDTNKVLNEFEIRYILGETNDYETFVENWKAAGGDELVAQAEEQYRQLGLLD